MAKKRNAEIKRKTREVDISGKIVIDGQGKSKISTGFKSLDHMLELMVFHGIFDLSLRAKGDLAHHIVEDLGIALGDGFKAALGKAEGIRRYGHTSVPMDEVLASVAVDISGRPKLLFSGQAVTINAFEEVLDLKSTDFKIFLEAFVEHAKIALNINLMTGPAEADTHHIFEAIFKALGIALDMAVQIDPRRKGIPSTKGVID